MEPTSAYRKKKVSVPKRSRKPNGKRKVAKKKRESNFPLLRILHIAKYRIARLEDMLPEYILFYEDNM